MCNQVKNSSKHGRHNKSHEKQFVPLKPEIIFKQLE